MEKNNTTQQEQNIPDINVVIDNTDDAIGWLERFLELLTKYGFWKILGATIGIAIVSIMLYFALNWQKGFELYDAWKARQHDDKMELRMEIGPKIQTLTDKLTFTVNATRTVVLEMHNGNTGNGGLPFTKCTATYESLNIGKMPVAEQYQEQNMSLIPFASFLFKRGYWCGSIEEIESIDRALYYKMKMNGVEHFAACTIEGIDNKAIAFMIVTFDEETDFTKHDCEQTRNYIRHAAMELSVFLEVTRLIDMNKR